VARQAAGKVVVMVELTAIHTFKMQYAGCLDFGKEADHKALAEGIRLVIENIHIETE
jgi:hypothetical protein